MTDRAAVVVALLILAPVTVVLLAAIVRGYSVSLTMRHRGRRRRPPPE